MAQSSTRNPETGKKIIMTVDSEEDKSVPENVIRVVDVKTKKQLDDSPEIVRLTPTGKISHAKTRVYTQRYRKEWEHMADFKDWLTSVPNQATRAYCKFCSRNLHAHRLSLLKHMCTLKHQRAAVHFNKKHGIEAERTVVREVAEYDDDDDENMSYEEVEIYSQEGEEDDGDQEADAVQEETREESESEEETPLFKKIRIKKDSGNDTLAQAIARAQSDYLGENNEPIHLEMVVESDHDDDEEDTGTYQSVEYESLSNSKAQSEPEKEDTDKNSKQNSDEESQPANVNKETVKSIVVSECKNDSDNSKKMYFFSSGGKQYTLVKSQLPKMVVSQLSDKNFTVVTKAIKNDSNSIVLSGVSAAASTSQEPKNKNMPISNTSSLITKSILRKPLVSTHVLETSKGIPAAGLQVSLYKLQDGRWTFIHESMTTASGNCNEFSSVKSILTTGRYKLHYDVEKYYNMKKTATIYPFIEIVFDIKDPNGSYHIPLLLSPFSYSTYKDTPK